MEENFNDTPKISTKSALIITLSAVAVILAAIALIVFFVAKSSNGDPVDTGDPSHSDSVGGNENKYLFDDGDIDPENAEITEEIGKNVDVKDLRDESGRTNGIDVSKWQSKIDWQKVADGGIDFAFIRIGYRGEDGRIYKDDNADYNIQSADKAGVLVGVYFFSTARTVAEATEEAEWTINAIKGYSISYPVVYDCEGFKVQGSRMYGISSEVRTQNALAFLNTVSDAGYEVMLYGAKNELESSDYWNMSEIEGKYMIWVAHYPTETYPEKEFPDYGGNVSAWQYTNMGTVPGVEGNCDMVVCYFERSHASPKDPSAAPKEAAAPLTEDEKKYTAVNETVTAKIETNLRSAATTKSSIVATIKNGETVTRTGVGAHGWSRLEYNGMTVYAITSFLTTDLTAKPPEDTDDALAGNTFTDCSDSVTAKDYVNLRALPTTDSDIVGTLLAGDFLERTGTSDKGWSRLIYNEQTVYAVTSYLTTEYIEPSTDDEPTITDIFEPVDEQVTAKIETNLRTAPSQVRSEIVYTLKNGEYVHRIGVSSSGWSKLEWNGQIVYAVSSYLTTSSVDSDGFMDTNDYMTAKVEANLRTTPSTSDSEVVYTLKNGEFIHRIGVNASGWSKFEYNGQVVYGVTSYFTTEGYEGGV